MDLLELALKRSIEWSIKSRLVEQVGADSTNCDRQLLEMNQKIEQDSHARAFITRFKIELNLLIGLSESSRAQLAEEKQDSSSDRDSPDTDLEEQLRPHYKTKQRPSNKRGPLIEITGKHFGIYNLNEDLDEELTDEELLRHLSAPKSSKPTSGEFIVSDVDDGYRSLSRNSLKSNLIQQLNDIKSRLLDLVHEIDLCVESKLSRDQVEAYQRRRDALISKLDSLIDSNLQRINGDHLMSIECPANFEDTPKSTQNNLRNNLNLHLTSSSSSSSSSSSGSSGSRSSSSTLATSSSRSSKLSLRRQKSKSFSSPTKPLIRQNLEYEEQVHVIDYNFRRRPSNTNLADVSKKPLILAASTTKIDLCSTTIDDAISNIQSKKDQRIDFGAMMRNYEQKQLQRQDEKKSSYYTENVILQSQPTMIKTNQHAPSYSISSNASSSSFL